MEDIQHFCGLPMPFPSDRPIDRLQPCSTLLTEGTEWCRGIGQLLTLKDKDLIELPLS